MSHSPEDISLADLREGIAVHLRKTILPFWLLQAVDDRISGFVGEISCDHVVNAYAPKGLILNARLLWTFAALHRWQADECCAALARRAYDTLLSTFWDAKYGGLFWTVDVQGRCLEPIKKIYGQAFAVYALCEYGVAFEEPEAMQRAVDVFDLIEAHSHDDYHGGYIEVCERDWLPSRDNRLSDIDMDEKKSMNNHLHLLEAYTRLLICRPDERVRQRLAELIDLFVTRIVTPDGRHLNHFFDETWACRSDSYTYGHDIEASWLLCEAVAALGDSDQRKRVEALALKLARATLDEAVDAQGGLCYEGRDGKVIDPNREWWPQAEGMVGFLNAYELSGEAVYLQAVRGLWDFIERYVVDPDHGEWFWRVDPQGRPDRSKPKLSQWKAPYHNIRACLECMARLDRLI